MKNRRPELIAAFAFVAIHLAAPLLIGERYPFTISPMFRDQPQHYCLYEVFGPDGKPIAELDEFGLHLVYDGNPPGLGMGIQAKPTLHEFGEIGSEAAVRDQVAMVLLERSDWEFVTVKQTVVRRDGNQVCSQVRSWRIDGPQADQADTSPGSQLSEPAGNQPAGNEPAVGSGSSATSAANSESDNAESDNAESDNSESAKADRSKGQDD